MTGTARRHAASAAGEPLAQPTASANAAPSSSADASVRTGATQVKLCAMTFWNRPAAVGEARSAQASWAPADSPNIVTFRGSPPKALALRRTQRWAACSPARTVPRSSRRPPCFR
ncbi:Uncharacterised protein [Mycobacterium tuberculosis]|nr:Uncharacterised protein [Mycobacterium tuberculosis]